MINAIHKSNNFSFQMSHKRQLQDDDKISVEIKDYYSPYNGLSVVLNKDEFSRYQAGVDDTQKTLLKSTLIGLGMGIGASICIKKYAKGLPSKEDSPLAGAQLFISFFSSMIGFIIGSEVAYRQNRESLDIPKNKMAKLVIEKLYGKPQTKLESNTADNQK